MLWYAMAFQNTPYCLNCEGPDGFDESGFTMFVFKELGYTLPKDVTSQVKAGEKIKKISKLKSGDLVFFKCEKKNSIYSVGSVHSVNDDGSFQFIYADKNKGIVMNNNLATMFKDSFLY